MIRSVPGSVKDIKTLSNTIKEMDIEGKLLILDRGFFSEEVIKDLSEAKIDYVLPTRRNSHYYDVRIGDRTLISEVPKKVRDLDSKLGLSLFPTT